MRFMNGQVLKSRVLRVGVVAALLLPAFVLTQAQGDTFERFRPFRPNPQRTEAAGEGSSTGGVSITLGPGRNKPLASIALSESLNRPAFARIGFLEQEWLGDADPPRWRVGQPWLTQTWRSPDITADINHYSELEVSIYESGDSRDQLRFVRGISVCKSSGALTNNDRVKGIRLWWGTVPDGATNTHDVTTRPNPKEFRRTNCNNNNGWSPRQLCPERYVATGVVLHSTPSDGVVGFSLLCDILEFASDEEGAAHWTAQQGSFGGVRGPEPRFETLTPGQTPSRRR